MEKVPQTFSGGGGAFGQIIVNVESVMFCLSAWIHLLPLIRRCLPLKRKVAAPFHKFGPRPLSLDAPGTVVSLLSFDRTIH